jgi:putative redox protein
MSHTRRVTVAENGRGRYANDVTVGRHELVVDEPESLGGDDLGPNPYDHLCIALGACTSMTIRMYAERKGWALGRVTVEVDHAKRSGTDVFTRVLHLQGDLDDEQRTRLLEIADRCPVHRTLSTGATIETEMP